MYERKCDYSSMGDAKSWSLIELAARYYNHKKTDGCSPSFLSSVKRHIQYFMVWLKKQGFDPGQNKTNNLTSVILAGYRQMLADDNTISIVTANHYIGHIRMLLNWGWRMHGISHPPIGSISQFSTKKRAKKGHGRKQCRDPLTWNELEKLFSVANVTDSALLMLGLNCGFGNMDIGTLKLSDIDLENGTISHPRPKTGVERNFNLWPETIEVLKEYIAEYRGKPVNEGVAKLVFVGSKGNPLCWDRIDEKGKLKRSDAIMSRFKRLFEKAGLKRKYGVGFYILRHTYATIIGSNSNDLREVQAALGQTTFGQQETYRHDRHQKSVSAQKKVRKELHNTPIPQILRKKCSCSKPEPELDEKPQTQEPAAPKPFAQDYLF
jgi:integrase